MMKKLLLTSVALSFCLFSCSLPNTQNPLIMVSENTYEYDLGKKNNFRNGAKITVKISSLAFKTKSSADGVPAKTIANVSKFKVNLCTDPTKPLNSKVFSDIDINYNGGASGDQIINFLNVPAGTYFATVEALDSNGNNITEANNNSNPYPAPDTNAQVAVSTNSVEVNDLLALVFSDAPNNFLEVQLNLKNSIGAKLDTIVTPAAGSNGLFKETATGEFAVNTLGNNPSNPAVAIADPVVVIVWQGTGSDGNDDIFARVYDQSGQPLGTEFRVNDTETGTQQNPDVAMDSNGNFVVVWESDTPSQEIYFKKFQSNGTALVSETIVNDVTNGIQANPKIAMESSGKFAITWETPDTDLFGVAAKVFNSNGTQVGSEFLVNTTKNLEQIKPDITIDSTSNIAVVWQSDTQDGDGYGIFARRLAASGTAITSEIPVNKSTTGNQENPSVALIDSNGFAVVWDSKGLFNKDIQYRSFQANGTANEINDQQVNDFNIGDQHFPVIAVNNTLKDKVFVWQSFQDVPDSNLGVYFKKKNLTALDLSVERQANNTAAGAQIQPAVSISDNGLYIIVWEDGNGIFAKRYKAFSEL